MKTLVRIEGFGAPYWRDAQNKYRQNKVKEHDHILKLE